MEEDPEDLEEALTCYGSYLDFCLDSLSLVLQDLSGSFVTFQHGVNMQLAQYNVARLAYPLDAPEMAGFFELLDPIHHAGDASKGFVWRFKGADGDYALDVRPSDGDGAILVAMTTWESIDDLDAFMKGPHLTAFLRRREWFIKGSGNNVCWWVPDGKQTTIAEGEERLAHLECFGPSRIAFTLRTAFTPEGEKYVLPAHQA